MQTFLFVYTEIFLHGFDAVGYMIEYLAAKKPATQIPKVCFWESWQNLEVSPENIASQTKIENRTSCLYN